MLLIVRLQLLVLIFASGVAGLTGMGSVIYPAVAVVAIVPFFVVLYVVSRDGVIRGFSGRYSFFDGISAALGLSFFALYFIALFRGVVAVDPEISKTSLLFLIFIFSACLVTYYFYFFSTRKTSSEEMLNYIMLCMAFFCAANIILWAVGVESPYQLGNTVVDDDASILGYIGISAKRVFFPMAPGVNTYGVAMGALLAYGVFQFPYYARRGFSSLLFCASMLIFFPTLTLLLLDSRGALMSVALAYIFSRWLRRYPALIVGLTVAVPLVLVAYGVGGGASRDASTSGLLSGREFIWAPAVLSIMKFDIGSFFGYGAYGQAVSGVSRYYSSAFAGWVENEDMISVHNAYLQVAMDVGLVGLLLFLFFFVVVINAMNRMESQGVLSRGSALSINAIMIFLVIQGMTDVTLSPMNFHAFLMLMAIAGIFINGSHSKRLSLDARSLARNMRE